MFEINDLSIAFIIVLLFFVYLGWMYRTEDDEEFHTVNRRAGVFRTGASFFTVVGAPHFTLMALFAYTYGWWSLALYAGSLTGFTALCFLATRIRSHLSEQPHSFADIAMGQIGQPATFTLSAIGVLFSFAVTVMQVIIGAAILAQVAGMSYPFSVFITVIAVLGYLIWGGYRALLLTDVVQAAVMAILTPLLGWFAWFFISHPEGAIQAVVPTRETLWPLIPVLYMAGFVLELGAASNWQRILTARSDTKAILSLMAGGLSIFIWGAFVVAIGVAIASAFPNIDPSGAFIEVTTKHFPHWLTGLVVVLLLSSLISTADTTLFMAAVMFNKEWKRLRGAGHNQLARQTTRWLMVGLSALVLLFSLFIEDSVNAWGFVLSLAYIAGPVSIAIILQRGGKTLETRRMTITVSAIIAVIALCAIYLFVGKTFTEWDFAIVAIASFPLLLSGPIDANSQSKKSAK